jgi:uncharacterized protein (TIGR00369 family)
VLDDVATWALATAAVARQGAPLARAADYQHRRYLDPPPPDGSVIVALSDRPVSGPANPSAVDVTIRRDGGEAVADVVFDRRFEASPGRVHGGITAAVFDDVMGYVNVVDGVAAYTLELTVRYLAPMPLGQPVQFRARTTERDDRRSTVTAEARASDDDRLLADATATFAVLSPERLGLRRNG